MLAFGVYYCVLWTFRPSGCSGDQLLPTDTDAVQGFSLLWLFGCCERQRELPTCLLSRPDAFLQGDEGIKKGVMSKQFHSKKYKKERKKKRGRIVQCPYFTFHFNYSQRECLLSRSHRNPLSACPTCIPIHQVQRVGPQHHRDWV